MFEEENGRIKEAYELIDLVTAVDLYIGYIVQCIERTQEFDIDRWQEFGIYLGASLHEHLAEILEDSEKGALNEYIAKVQKDVEDAFNSPQEVEGFIGNIDPKELN